MLLICVLSWKSSNIRDNLNILEIKASNRSDLLSVTPKRYIGVHLIECIWKCNRLGARKLMRRFNVTTGNIYLNFRVKMINA